MPLSRSDGERKGKKEKKFNPIPQKAKSPEGIQGYKISRSILQR